MIHINIEFLQMFTTKENKFLVNKDQKVAGPSEKMMEPSQYTAKCHYNAVQFIMILHMALR